MSKKSNSSGVGFTGFLTLIFITLKLTGYIDWSWWLVLSPIWSIIALVLIIGLVALIYVKFRS